MNRRVLAGLASIVFIGLLSACQGVGDGGDGELPASRSAAPAPTSSAASPAPLPSLVDPEPDISGTHTPEDVAAVLVAISGDVSFHAIDGAEVARIWSLLDVDEIEPQECTDLQMMSTGPVLADEYQSFSDYMVAPDRIEIGGSGEALLVTVRGFASDDAARAYFDSAGSEAVACPQWSRGRDVTVTKVSGPTALAASGWDIWTWEDSVGEGTRPTPTHLLVRANIVVTVQDFGPNTVSAEEVARRGGEALA